MDYNIIEYKNEFNSLYLKLKEVRKTSKNIIVIVTNSSLGYIATKYADFVLFTDAPYELTRDNYIYLPTIEKATEMAIRIINPKDTLLITDTTLEELEKSLLDYKKTYEIS